MGEALWSLTLIFLWPVIDIWDRFLDIVMVVIPSIQKKLKKEEYGAYFVLSSLFLLGLVVGLLFYPLGREINLLRESVVVYAVGVVIAIIIHLFQVKWVLPLMIVRSMMLGCMISFWLFELFYR